jgi:hypothetical protein
MIKYIFTGNKNRKKQYIFNIREQTLDLEKIIRIPLR